MAKNWEQRSREPKAAYAIFLRFCTFAGTLEEFATLENYVEVPEKWRGWHNKYDWLNRRATYKHTRSALDKHQHEITQI